MPESGAEAFRAAFRRSVPLIIALMLLGFVAVNAVRQLQGERYTASARVLISATPLSEILTETQPPFVDPQRTQDTAQALATSPEVYRLAARGRALGTPQELKAASSVTAATSNDILVFTATSADAERTVAIVNAVAEAYTTFRGDLSRSSVTQATRQLQRTVDTWPDGSSPPEDLVRQLNRLRVLQSLNASDAQVVDRADAATQTSPSPIKDSLLGLSLGLVIALIAVALREAIDTKVRSDGVIEEVLATPVIGSIPSLPRGSRLVTYGRHEPTFADSYALLASQLSAEPGVEHSQVLAITSALANEGKTTTSANLAVALARRGQSVLLADFDFRKRSLADLFDVPSTEPGALQVMSGTSRLEDVLWSVSLEGAAPQVTHNGDRPLRTTAGSLRLLPAGAATGQSDAISVQLGPLVRELRRHADVVVLDTPAALLTVEMAELSRLVDSVVVVVRQGRISQRTLRSLGRQARTWDAEIAGAVVTDTVSEASQVGPYASR
jgi:polysaccharide biosynthesis transport protein